MHVSFKLLQNDAAAVVVMGIISYVVVFPLYSENIGIIVKLLFFSRLYY